jgi:hypothetical protein
MRWEGSARGCPDEQKVSSFKLCLAGNTIVSEVVVLLLGFAKSFHCRWADLHHSRKWHELVGLNFSLRYSVVC